MVKVVLRGDHLHDALDAESGSLQIFNVDLRIAPALAKRLGRSDLTGVAVGMLTLTAAVDVPEGAVVGNVCPPNWEGDVDVLLLGLNSVGQQARFGGQVVMTPSASLKNVGTADVPWYTQFSGFFPPYDNDQHPFLVWAVYRVTEEEGMRQLGVSQVKHAFLTINSNCTGCGADSHILGLGCEDVYGKSTNSNTSSLGPREEITAQTGIWAHCDEPEANTPSHFDTDGDCFPEHRGEDEDDFSHGLIVNESDLTEPEAAYYFQAWYVVRDDINIFNTMGWRQIDPILAGDVWTFSFLTDPVNSSPVDAWVDPQATEPDAMNQMLANLDGSPHPDGHLQLAVRTSDLGDNRVRFNYALMNHDYDRRGQAFRLPLGSGVRVDRTSFHDLDDEPSNDWQVAVTDTHIEWRVPDSQEPNNTLDRSSSRDSATTC